MRRRAAFVGAILVAIVALLPTGALAAPVLMLVPAAVEAGEQLTVEGDAFASGVNLQLYLDDVERGGFLGAVKADRRGDFTKLVTIPGATTPGEHTVLACERISGGTCRVRATAKLTVRAPASSPSSSPTGSPTATGTPASSTPPAKSPTPSSTASAVPVAPTTASASPFKIGVDLSVTGIEVTQGIQNLNNNMPLLPLRPTYARVYVHVPEGQLNHVKGFLAAIDAGKWIGLTSAVNQPVVALSQQFRSSVFFSLLFKVPNGWTTRGKITLIAFAYEDNVDTVDHEPNADNNVKAMSVTFGNKAVLYRAVLVPVHMHKGYQKENDQNTFLPISNQTATARILNGVERLLPISMLLPILLPFDMRPPGHATGAEWDLHEEGPRYDPQRERVHAQLASWKEQSGALLGVYQWYGMLPNSGDPSQEWNQTLKKGVTFAGQSSGGVSIGKMSATQGDMPYEIIGSTTMGHEWGHDLGLSHYGCVASGDPASPTKEQAGGGLDPNFPTGYPKCSLALVDSKGYYGLDVHYDRFDLERPDVISNDPTSKERGFPLMSYAGRKWLDPYSACKMLNALDVPCNAYPPQSPGPGGPTGLQGLGLFDAKMIGAQAAGQDVLMISGSATTSGTAGGFFELALLDDVPTETTNRSAKRLAAAPPGSPLNIVLQDKDRKELARYRLARDGTPEHSSQEDDFAFVEWVPAPDGLSRVVLLGSGRELASATPSASDPSIEIIAPTDGVSLSGSFEVRWQGSDPDRDALTYDVFTSADGGASWTVAARALSEQSLSMSTSQLAGGNRTRIRVRASDGFNTASDDTGNLRVPNSGPNLVLIMSPPDRATYRTSDLVVLNGRAMDLADERVANLAWSSDRDGSLGTGSEVETRSLTPGKHVITLRATDRGGASAEQRVTITIDPNSRADVPDTATIARVSRLLQDRFVSVAGPPWPVIGGVAGGLLVLIAGAFVFRLRSR